MITHMTGADGLDRTDRQTIADIFADIYKKLYATRTTPHEHHEYDHTSEILELTRSELEATIKGLRTGRTCDGAGVFAKLIKNGAPRLTDVLLDLYNQTIALNASTLANWKVSIVAVFHKSGEHNTPEHYRPITILPLLYKLFAKLLYSRFLPINQSDKLLYAKLLFDKK